MKKIVFIALTSLGLSVGLYQAAFAKLQAIGCSVTLNSDGSFTQHGCSTRGNDTFQVISGAKITIPASVKAITCQVTHTSGNVMPGYFNAEYFSSSSRTSASTFSVNVFEQGGEVVIPNGTRLFDVSFKHKWWDFANSELNCSIVR